MMRIFGARSEEIVEGCRKLCNGTQCGFYKTRCGFYSLQDIIKMNKSRKIGWIRHVECIEDTANGNILFVRENVGNTSHLKDVGTDRKYMMITINSNSVVGGFGLDSSSSGDSGGLF